MSTVHVLAPIASPDEVGALIDAGATRLYCGVEPAAWSRRYSRAVWLTRRGGAANLRDLASLATVSDLARGRGVGVHLALNAPAYNDEQLEMVTGLARRAVEEIGVEAVIVADVTLMSALGQLGVPFVASTVAVAHNAEALRLFHDLGAVGAVLPRHLSLPEIASIAGEVPELEIETIVLYDGCAWEEGLCRTVHGVATTAAFCRTDWSMELEVLDAAVEAEAIETRFREWREWVGWADACGAPVGASGAPGGACGLCAIPTLVGAGVRALKIGGRQGGPTRRLRGVQMVRAVLGAGAGGATMARCLRDAPGACASGLMCYWPVP